MTFPNSAHDGLTLLLLRVNLLQWSTRTGITHNFNLNEQLGLIVTLPKLQHYTQFALQWEYDDFHIHKSKKYIKKFQTTEICLTRKFLHCILIACT